MCKVYLLTSIYSTRRIRMYFSSFENPHSTLKKYSSKDIMDIFKTLNLLLFLVTCSTPNTQNDGVIRFNWQEYDFGIIPLKEEMQYGFEFFNPGKTPRVINNVKTSCACTIPEWPRKPIMPGAKGEIKVAYDAASPRVFHKTITVYFNGKDSPVQLSIKGQVGLPEQNENK